MLPALKSWVAKLDPKDPRLEHHQFEALWTTWGLNHVDEALLRQLLAAKDFHARAAAVRVLHYNTHAVAEHAALLEKAAADPQGRGRLEAIIAASWMNNAAGKKIVAIAAGHEIYFREAHCATCHMPDGKGLDPAFPPLAASPWVSGDPQRLIKLTLHGMIGPFELKGKKFNGLVPMTPFGGMLKDDEIAAVLTYVRNNIGNKVPAVHAAEVTEVRTGTKARQSFYIAEELLKEHPLE